MPGLILEIIAQTWIDRLLVRHGIGIARRIAIGFLVTPDAACLAMFDTRPMLGWAVKPGIVVQITKSMGRVTMGTFGVVALLIEGIVVKLILIHGCERPCRLGVSANDEET